MKHLTTYKLFESKDIDELKGPIIDILQDIIDSKIDCNVYGGEIYGNQILISLKPKRGYNSAMAWGDSGNLKMVPVDHIVDIRNSIIHLQNYVSDYGYTVGMYRDVDGEGGGDMSVEDYDKYDEIQIFTTLLIILEKEEMVKESLDFIDITNTIKDIGLDIEDSGFNVVPTLIPGDECFTITIFKPLYGTNQWEEFYLKDITKCSMQIINFMRSEGYHQPMIFACYNNHGYRGGKVHIGWGKFDPDKNSEEQYYKDEIRYLEMTFDKKISLRKDYIKESIDNDYVEDVKNMLLDIEDLGLEVKLKHFDDPSYRDDNFRIYIGGNVGDTVKWNDVSDYIERIILYLDSNGMHGVVLDIDSKSYYKNIYNLFGKIKYAKTKKNIYYDTSGRKTTIDPNTEFRSIIIKWKIRRR